MIFQLPVLKDRIAKIIVKVTGVVSYTKQYISSKQRLYSLLALLDLAIIMIIIINGIQPAQRIFDPVVTSVVTPMMPLKPIEAKKSQKEVFGFAPYWTFDKLNTVNFDVLTTFAYFGVEVGPGGYLVKDDVGYTTFKSKKATALFKKAHQHGTRVVLTLTQMNNNSIIQILDNPDAQTIAINQAVSEVEARGIDGINLDFEYAGDPGEAYRNKFTQFAARLTQKMHEEVPSSQVTVSVYASSVKDPKIYNIAALSASTDGIFMMAYDFAHLNADHAIPTAPLYGHKEGKYWYDVSTAVDDFLSVMPAEKLILGVPWYGYNYLVYQPQVKAETRPSYYWSGKPVVQTYGYAHESVRSDMPNINGYMSGWDDAGKVEWRAYYVPAVGSWRMIFIENRESLGIKYDFALYKHLGGVGIWALGFEEGKHEVWDLLAEKFGMKLADAFIVNKNIQETYE